MVDLLIFCLDLLGGEMGGISRRGILWRSLRGALGSRTRLTNAAFRRPTRSGLGPRGPALSVVSSTTVMWPSLGRMARSVTQQDFLGNEAVSSERPPSGNPGQGVGGSRCAETQSRWSRCSRVPTRGSSSPSTSATRTGGRSSASASSTTSRESPGRGALPTSSEA